MNNADLIACAVIWLIIGLTFGVVVTLLIREGNDD